MQEFPLEMHEKVNSLLAKKEEPVQKVDSNGISESEKNALSQILGKSIPASELEKPKKIEENTIFFQPDKDSIFSEFNTIVESESSKHGIETTPEEVFECILKKMFGEDNIESGLRKLVKSLDSHKGNLKDGQVVTVESEDGPVSHKVKIKDGKVVLEKIQKEKEVDLSSLDFDSIEKKIEDLLS